jgi:predicted nucleic acid-binding Zn ribbon protein
VVRTYKPRQPVARACAVCGKIVQARPNRRYCSAACKHRAYRNRKDAGPKIKKPGG